MKKRDSKKIIGRVQLYIGIILFIVGIIILIINYNWYKDTISESASIFQNGIKSLSTLKNNMLISNETNLITSLEYSTYYLEQHFQAAQGLANTELMSLLIIIISILFITQGLINSSRRSR